MIELIKGPIVTRAPLSQRLAIMELDWEIILASLPQKNVPEEEEKRKSVFIKGLLSSRNGRPLSALQRKGCMSEDQVNRQTCNFSYLMDIGTVKNIKIIFI